MSKPSKVGRIALVALAAIGILGCTSAPVWADTEIQPREIQPRTSEDEDIAPPENAAIDGTFAVDETKDTAILKLGHNILVAGSDVSDNAKTDSLYFAAGNSLKLNSWSEYSFIAGNIVDYTGRTEKDLFIAGNVIKLESKAEIGRDIYITGNSVTVSTDVDGDLSVASATVILDDIDIAGNLNLSAEKIVINGTVKAGGAIVYNADADITGLANLSGASVETYEVEHYEPTLVAIWYAKLLSVVALFVAMIVAILIWRGVPACINSDANTTSIARRLVIGLGVLLLVPIIALFALMSYVLAPLALIMLALYIIMIYLSQGFAGLWLGHIIMNKGLKISSNAVVEAGTGILVLGIFSLVPYIGVLTGLLGLLFGLGTIVDCLRGGTKKVAKAQETAAVVAAPAKAKKSTRNAAASTKRVATTTSKRGTTAKRSKSNQGGQKAKK